MCINKMWVCTNLKGMFMLTNLCFECGSVKIIGEEETIQRLHQDVLKYMGGICKMGAVIFCYSPFSVVFTVCVKSWKTYL